MNEPPEMVTVERESQDDWRESTLPNTNGRLSMSVVAAKLYSGLRYTLIG